MRQLAEADAADAELTHISMRSPAELAAIVATHGKFRCALGFLYQALFGHKCSSENLFGVETGNSIPENPQN